MSIRKTPGGRWRGVVKAGREQVASRTFDTRREASVGGPRTSSPRRRRRPAGRSTHRPVAAAEWLAEREHAVSRKTYVADSALVRLVPPSLAALQIGAVTEREVTRALIALNRTAWPSRR